MPKQLKINPTALLLSVVGFFLAFKNIGDLDFWWHLRTGKWIVENKEFVHSDFLSYTFKGAPWMDLTWGGEVIQYLLYSITENYWLISAFFGLVGALTAYFCYLTFELFLKKKDTCVEFLGVLLFALGLYFVDFRWNHRPEQFTHLYGILLFYILFKNQKKESREIWWIPVIQIAWVNTHGMFLMGPVITGIFLFQNVIKEGGANLFGKVLSNRLLKVLGVQFLVCLINPRGWDGALFPIKLWEVLNHPFYRNTIPEGTNPYSGGTWGMDTWGLTIYLVLFSLSILYPFDKKQCKAKINFYGIGYLLFSLLLIRLSVIARRNIAVFVLWTLPFVAFEISSLIKEKVAFFQEIPFQQKARFYTASAICVICFGLFTNLFRPEGQERRFGGAVSSFDFPFGAVEKLKKIEKLPRFFAGVQFSDFMDFHLKGYESYIDGRFAEVYPREHFQRYMDILAHPRLIDKEVEKWNIEAMGLETRNPMMHALIRYIGQNPSWKLFYLDEAAVIFFKVKKGEPAPNNTKIAEEEGKRRIEEITRMSTDWNPFNYRTNADKAIGLSKLSESLLLLEASSVADDALTVAVKVQHDLPAALSMQCVIAFSLLQMRVEKVITNQEALTQVVSEFAPQVEEKCRKAKVKGADITTALYTSALLHFNLGRYEDSTREFSELVKRDPLGPLGHMLLGRSLAAIGRVEEAESSYLEASRLRPLDGQFLIELAEVMEKVGRKDKADFYKVEATNRMHMEALDH